MSFADILGSKFRVLAVKTFFFKKMHVFLRFEGIADVCVGGGRYPIN